MKRSLITAALIVVATIVVNGQEKSSRPVTDKNKPTSVQNPSEASYSIVVIHKQNSEDDGKSSRKESGGYFSRLASPENLPNIFLVVVAAITAWYVAKQAKETAEATQAMRDSIPHQQQAAEATNRMAVATLRPRLTVPAIALIPGELVDVDGVQTLKDHENWRIECLIANIGGSKADIMESNLTLSQLGIADSATGLLPVFPPYSASRDSFGTVTIESGERHRSCIVLDRVTDTMRLRILYQMEKSGSNTSTTQVICFGFLKYTDAAGVGRRTGFAFTYNAKSMSFSRLEHPSYDYAD